MGARESIVIQIPIHPIEIKGHNKGLTNPAILKDRPTGIHHKRPHSNGALVNQLQLFHPTLLHSRERIGCLPPLWIFLDEEIKLTRLKSLKQDIDIAVIIVPDGLKIIEPPFVHSGLWPSNHPAVRRKCYAPSSPL